MVIKPLFKKSMLSLRQGFPGGSAEKNLPATVGDSDSIPWVRKIPCRRKWQPTPVFLPGKLHGQRSLVGYSPLGCKKESDKTECAPHTYTHTQNELLDTL